MASFRAYCCILLSLFPIVYGNVPVLLWESSKSDRANTFPAFHWLSKRDFQQYLLKKVHGEQPAPLVVYFNEPTLSMEDFSWQDSQGQGYFPQLKYITSNAANTEFIPMVQEPMEAVKQFKESGNSIKTVYPSEIPDLSNICGEVLMINQKEAKQEENRADMLRRHDAKIAEVYSQLLAKCSHVIGILSGQQPSWVEPEEVTRLRRSTDDNSTSANTHVLEDSRGTSLVYFSQIPKLYLNGKEISLPTATRVIGGDNSKPNNIKLFVKYNNEFRLTFNFDNITAGYWYLRSIDFTNITQNENFILKSSHDIYAPLGMSYHCGTKVVFRNVTNDNVRELVFPDIQVEPFFSKAGTGSFSEAVDEVPFFTPAIWSGIFVTFLLALIFTWGVSMIMDIRTMDQFDDPKGKTITVSATD